MSTEYCALSFWKETMLQSQVQNTLFAFGGAQYKGIVVYLLLNLEKCHKNEKKEKKSISRNSVLSECH